MILPPAWVLFITTSINIDKFDQMLNLNEIRKLWYQYNNIVRCLNDQSKSDFNNASKVR